MPFPRIESAFGKSQPLADWAREYGIKYSMLKDRMGLGWSLEEALTRGKRDTRKLRPEDEASPTNHRGLKKFAAYVGEKIGRLRITGYRPGSKADKTRARFECLCVCGKTLTRSPYNLLYSAGPEASCGCYCSERMAAMNRAAAKHGLSRSPEYRVWASMKARCENPRSQAYKYYGARGIKVCPAWSESFESFYADMGPRPFKRAEIDRKDNDGPYSPENCAWTTHRQNINNRRCTLTVEIGGTTKPLSVWAAEAGLAYNVVVCRFRRGERGANLTRPVGRRR